MSIQRIVVGALSGSVPFPPDAVYYTLFEASQPAAAGHNKSWYDRVLNVLADNPYWWESTYFGHDPTDVAGPSATVATALEWNGTTTNFGGGVIHCQGVANITGPALDLGSPFTLCQFVKLASAGPVERTILCTAGLYDGWLYVRDDPVTGTPKLYFACSASDPIVEHELISDVSSWIGAGWLFLVVDYDGTTLRAKVNDVVVGSVAVTIPTSSGTGFYFGARDRHPLPDGPSTTTEGEDCPWNGDLTGFIAWASKLSDADETTVYETLTV